MLKIDGKNGHVAICGEAKDLLAEMTTLIHTLYERFCDYTGDPETTADTFHWCFDHALKGMDELEDELDEEIWSRIAGDNE